MTVNNYPTSGTRVSEYPIVCNINGEPLVLAGNYRLGVSGISLQTGKKYILVEENELGTMVYNGTTYMFVETIAQFPITTHEVAGIEMTYEYGGDTIVYNDQVYEFIASGITDPAASGGYSGYSAETSRTVESLLERENFVNFYYIALTPPEVTIDSITDISLLNGFTANCNLVKKVKAVSMCGIVWGISPLPVLEYDYSIVVGPKEEGSFIATYRGDGLEPDTTYYVRAFAINEYGIGYSHPRSFTIESSLPVVVTKSVESITESGFMAVVSVEELGAKSVVYGFCWGTEPNPTLETASVVVAGTKTTPGEHRISYQSPVEADTTYYLAAYATNIVGTAYGEDIEFVLPSKYIWEFIATPKHSNLLGLDQPDHAFIELKDTPNVYEGNAGKVVAVKRDESGLEFIEASTGRGTIGHYEPLTNGNPDDPQLLFTPDGDILMGRVI